MSISIDAVELPDLVPVPDFEFGDSGVDSRFYQSRAGTPIIFEQSRGYKEVDLVGGSNTGWVTRDTLKNLQSIANIPNTEYTLTYEGVLYNIRFRNWEQPVIEADPLVPRPNPSDSDLYHNLVIKLILLI